MFKFLFVCLKLIIFLVKNKNIMVVDLQSDIEGLAYKCLTIFNVDACKKKKDVF
jgi:hypothetical protein